MWQHGAPIHFMNQRDSRTPLQYAELIADETKTPTLEKAQKRPKASPEFNQRLKSGLEVPSLFLYFKWAQIKIIL